MEEQKIEGSLEVSSTETSENLNQQNGAPVLEAQPVASMPQEAAPVKYAGFWIRWVASFIDGIVVFFMAMPLMIIFALVSGEFSTFIKGEESSLGINFLGYAVTWGYYIVMTDRYQATVGKKLMGIMVLGEDLNRVPVGKIVLRETVGKLVSGIILLIGYIMAAFTDRKRALHDMISGTVVIYNPNAKKSKGLIIGVIVAVVLFFVVIVGLVASIVLVSLSSAREKAQDAAERARQNSMEIEALDYQLETMEGVE